MPLGNHLAPMQPTELGAYRVDRYMPRFEPIGISLFVQILNVGDHWICVTNVNGNTTHDVSVYDSRYTTVSRSTVAQVTSLLRYEDNRDEIVFRVRPFNTQTAGNRLCGFYAVAAAFSLWNGEDPANTIFDETRMGEHLQMCLQENRVTPFPSMRADAREDAVHPKRKLHCKCLAASTTASTTSRRMIRCDGCYNWYHEFCVRLTPESTPLRTVSQNWLGPCCMRGDDTDLPIVV